MGLCAGDTITILYLACHRPTSLLKGLSCPNHVFCFAFIISISWWVWVSLECVILMWQMALNPKGLGQNVSTFAITQKKTRHFSQGIWYHWYLLGFTWLVREGVREYIKKEPGTRTYTVVLTFLWELLHQQRALSSWQVPFGLALQNFKENLIF